MTLLGFGGGLFDLLWNVTWRLLELLLRALEVILVALVYVLWIVAGFVWQHFFGLLQLVFIVACLGVVAFVVDATVGPALERRRAERSVYVPGPDEVARDEAANAALAEEMFGHAPAPTRTRCDVCLKPDGEGKIIYADEAAAWRAVAGAAQPLDVRRSGCRSGAPAARRRGAAAAMCRA